MPIDYKPFVRDVRDAFAPFLASLATIGILPTLRDYQRISRVLGAGGHWDIERLRFTLTALLVRSPEQETDFRRRFDSFFQPSQAETGLKDIDLNRALTELRQPADRDFILREHTPAQPLKEARPITTDRPTAPKPSLELNRKVNHKLSAPTVAVGERPKVQIS